MGSIAKTEKRGDTFSKRLENKKQVMPSATAPVSTGCFSFLFGGSDQSYVRTQSREAMSADPKIAAPFGVTKKGEARSLLLFDSDCLLCAGAVQFVLKYDYEERFVFMPLQSPKGKHFQKQYVHFSFSSSAKFWINLINKFLVLYCDFDFIDTFLT